MTDSFPPVHEQLDIIKRGTAEIIREEDLDQCVQVWRSGELQRDQFDATSYIPQPDGQVDGG